jgi:hypothetical protein
MKLIPTHFSTAVSLLFVSPAQYCHSEQLMTDIFIPVKTGRLYPHAGKSRRIVYLIP